MSVSVAEDDKTSSNDFEALRSDYASLQAAHKSLLERIQSDEGSLSGSAHGTEEANALGKQITILKDELSKTRTEKEELLATVRDLRVRVEEGRRAIMRLQGTSGSSNIPTLSNAAPPPSKRRSMGPGALASWNPKEMLPASASAEDVVHNSSSSTALAPEEAAELKRSKRATLTFGPGAGGANAVVGRKGHRRTASGGKGQAVSDAGSEANGSAAAHGLMGPPPSTGGGLRELRLAGSDNTVNGGGGRNQGGDSSKRSSIYSVANGIFSPASESSEFPPTDEGLPSSSGPGPSTLGSLLSAPRSIRRTSNSSSISGGGVSGEGQWSDVHNSLAVPNSTSRTSLSPTPSSLQSPIIEAGEEVELSYPEREDPSTAKAMPVPSGSTARGSFGAMQMQQQLSLAQRNVQEHTMRLKDRDDQLAELRRDMGRLRMELDEAKEARSASENCLKALRDFVRQEETQHGDVEKGDADEARALRGVKLPPLPTDKEEDDDIEGESQDAVEDAPATPQSKNVRASSIIGTPTASTWKNLGNTFSSLAKRPTINRSSDGSNESMTSSASRPLADLPDQKRDSTSTAGTGYSIGTLWSRATGASAGAAESITSSEKVSSADPIGYAGGSELKKTASVTSAKSNQSGESSHSTKPDVGSAAFRGFSWFNKRPTSDQSRESGLVSPAFESPSNPIAKVSSPPFANLDNHVLTLDAAESGTAKEGSLPSSRRASIRSGPDVADDAALQSAGASIEPNGRVKKAMDRTKAVDEDAGFVPPAF